MTYNTPIVPVGISRPFGGVITGNAFVHICTPHHLADPLQISGDDLIGVHNLSKTILRAGLKFMHKTRTLVGANIVSSMYVKANINQFAVGFGFAICELAKIFLASTTEYTNMYTTCHYVIYNGIESNYSTKTLFLAKSFLNHSPTL